MINYIEVAEEMLRKSSMEKLHPSLTSYLDDVNSLVERVDGQINSRQIVATNIQAWTFLNPDKYPLISKDVK